MQRQANRVSTPGASEEHSDHTPHSDDSGLYGDLDAPDPTEILDAKGTVTVHRDRYTRVLTHVASRCLVRGDSEVHRVNYGRIARAGLLKFRQSENVVDYVTLTGLGREHVRVFHPKILADNTGDDQ